MVSAYYLLLLGRVVCGVVGDSLGVCCGLFDGGAPAQRRLEDEVSRVEEETVHVSELNLTAARLVVADTAMHLMNDLIGLEALI